MKLHLPKGLRAALLACLSVMAGGLASADDTFTFDPMQSYSYTWDFSQDNTKPGNTGVLGGNVTNGFTTTPVSVGSSTITALTSTGSGRYYELNTSSFLHDALEVVKGTGGQGVFTVKVDYYWAGNNVAENVIHIGKHGTGISLGFCNGNISYYNGSAGMDRFRDNQTGLILTANTWKTITWTFKNGVWYASLDGVSTMKSSIGGISWADSDSEINKYCLGAEAPGYDSNGLNGSGGSKMSNLVISYEELVPMIWNGTEANNAWNATSTNWLENNASASYSQLDDVVFGADGFKTVSISESIYSGSVKIQDDYTFNLNQSSGKLWQACGGISISEGKSLSFTGEGIVKTCTVTGANTTLTIGGKSVLELLFTSSGGSSAIGGTVEVNITEGGQLKLSGHDTLGWGNNSPAAINMSGSSAAEKATLYINEIVSGSTSPIMTLRSVINMSGYSEMTGSGINTLGTAFYATGIDNVISSETILLRDALSVDVDNGGELTISSKLGDHADNKPKTITKTGEGRLIFTNTTSTWTKDLTVTGGTVQLKDGATLGTGAISLAKNTTLEIAGTKTLGNATTGEHVGKAVVGAGKLSVLAGGNLTITGNLTLGSTIENAGAFILDGGKLTFTSKDDLTPGGPGDVVYRDPILNQNAQQSTQNGYAEGTFIIIKNETGASATGITEIYITGEDDSFTGSDIVDDVNGVKIVGDKAMKGLYYVNSDAFKYGETEDDGTSVNSAASAATTGVVLNGNKLIMLTDLAENAANQDGIILVQKPADAAAGTPTSKIISVKDGVTLDNVALNVQDGIALKMQRYDKTEGDRNGKDIIMKQLTGDGTLVAGSGILVKESGSFTGSYEGNGDDDFVRLGTASEDAIQELRADAKLTVIGTAGTVKLTGLTDTAVGASNVLGGIATKDVSVNLGNLNVADNGTLTPTTVTLERESFMDRGVLEFAVSIEEVNNNLYATKADKPLVTSGEALNLSNVTLKIQEVNYMGVEYNAAGPETDILLFVLSDAQDSSAANISFDMSESKWLNKYFTNFRVEKGSINVVADANTGIYAAHGQTPNGLAGLGLAGKAMFRLNPQTKTPDSELAQVLNLLDDHNNAGNEAAMDRLGAALAGSSLPAVGMAVADDVQRQLRSIRNRTTTMGVNQCEVNEDMPYINGWISGDGSYSQLSASGTDSGYRVSSWGGTVGVDVDVNPNLTLGVAVSALFGDYTGKAEDVLKGDLDTQYVSLFARVSTGSWVNTFVGTLGRADVDLERTIPGVAGKTTYKTNGMMFGFLYEVARTFALNADATTCVQPLFNMSFSHTSLDGATEGGKADTRLTTDSASLTQFSLGLGGRLQSVVGENEYNRASIFEARALLKLDFGDRYNKLNTALAALPTATVTTRSNEKGVIGAELGATLTIPLSQDAGSIFFDVNADFNADEVGVNGSVGYRVNF